MHQAAYAQSLRVIGQALEKLRISAFVLEKETDRYIVRVGTKLFKEHR